MTPAERRELVDRQLRSLSIARQCQLMGVSRSSLYYRPKETSRQDLSLMRELDRQYLETSFYGSRRMKALLDRQGLPVSRKRVQRLMRIMGLRAIYRQPRTSQPAAGRRVYPYLLRDLTITQANQVWAADITYLPMARGFLYLVAIMDWHSRYVVAWGLSNTLETGFCAEALGDALNQGTPEVFNTDQGSQFTSREFTQILQDRGVKISMDGRGRYQDNILVERLWRSAGVPLNCGLILSNRWGPPQFPDPNHPPTTPESAGAAPVEPSHPPSTRRDVQRQLLLPVPSIILAGSPPVSDYAAGPLRCGSWGRRIPG